MLSTARLERHDTATGEQGAVKLQGSLNPCYERLEFDHPVRSVDSNTVSASKSSDNVG